MTIAYLAIPQPTEWQRVGNQIDAAKIFARVDFVGVHCTLSESLDFAP
jgi:hypothetical protein